MNRTLANPAPKIETTPLDAEGTLPPTSSEVLLIDSQDRLSAILADLMEFWGFTRTQGRIYGLLFLSPEPLDQSTIRDRLGISRGSASMTLNSLLEWGVIRQDDRFYTAETDFFKLVTRVVRRRERIRLQKAIEGLRDIAQSLQQDPENETLRFASDRIEHLHRFFETGLEFLDAVVEGNPVRSILNSLARRASRLSPTSAIRRSFSSRQKTTS